MDSFLYLLFVFVFVFLIFFLWIRIILYPVPLLRSTFGQTWLRDERRRRAARFGSGWKPAAQPERVDYYTCAKWI